MAKQQELGEPIEAVDPNETYVAGYYAVFSTDGEEWLSWTVDGWNADQTESDDRLDELRQEYLEEEGGGGGKILGGCGCASGAPTGALGLPVLLGLLGLRRR